LNLWMNLYYYRRHVNEHDPDHATNK
jgi:hypothetical protein